ncbi:MAG: hypothetical protein M3072_03005 [Candidatus Dormibacteraeota bacterium]|nr:hypothetical protein [Candidatus Dormibacteraeota bacterium]
MAPLPGGVTRLAAAFVSGLLALGLAGCQGPAVSSPPSLPSTLVFEPTPSGLIPYQDGIPVPSFSAQPRLVIDLNLPSWRFAPGGWDDAIDFRPRDSVALARIAAVAGGRQGRSYDDSGWENLAVPGSFNPPPAGGPSAGWYRLSFEVPSSWASLRPTLKFGAANYLADVWVNGHYLGYHEGGNTPFAFDATKVLVYGGSNLAAIHIVTSPSGERDDVVPWGLIDWWRYGGLTQPVWLEGTPAIRVARTEIRTHLDEADFSVVVENRSVATADVGLTLQILPAEVTKDNLLDPSPSSLIRPDSTPIVETHDQSILPAGSASRVQRSFGFANADLWSPQSPALFVLRVILTPAIGPIDEYLDTFGLRQLTVDPAAPRLLLNGQPVFLDGVALHNETLVPTDQPYPSGHPITTWAEQLAQLEQARQVNADFIRADHTPANPMLLSLADRLGFAVWEEIPLYHFRPPEFQATLARGIPQQMLAEMDLRDFNHPSVLFHGLANESSGDQERRDTLDQLSNLDRRIDGSRLVGQASYGSPPGDATSQSLDLAGYTYYYGVFYGGDDPGSATAAALDRAHATLPAKPILILEFGRWADSLEEEAAQTRVLSETLPPLEARADTRTSGFVGGIVWWSLNDYWSDLPGISVEHFGLFRPDGTPRPVAMQVAAAYAASDMPGGTGADRPRVTYAAARATAPPSPRLLADYLAYAVLVGLALLSISLVVVLRLRPAPI